MVKVKVSEVVAAMEMMDGDEMWSWLDTSTGEVVMVVSEAICGEPEPERPVGAVTIPAESSRDDWRLMERFALQLDDEHLRDELLRAIKGKGAFRRFEAVLNGWPGGARQAWFDFEHAARLEAARAWLEGLELDLEPIMPPPRLAVAAPVQTVTRDEGKFGLVEMLLFGAPDGKTEILGGRTLRLYTAKGDEEARKVFGWLARDVYEICGYEWRRRFIEGKSEVDQGRYHLRVEGNQVWLEVDVPPAVYRRFSA